MASLGRNRVYHTCCQVAAITAHKPDQTIVQQSGQQDLRFPNTVTEQVSQNIGK